MQQQGQRQEQQEKQQEKQEKQEQQEQAMRYKESQQAMHHGGRQQMGI